VPDPNSHDEQGRHGMTPWGRHSHQVNTKSESVVPECAKWRILTSTRILPMK
jgi:hypothetical protein